MSAQVRAAGLLVYRQLNDTIEYLLLQASYPPFHWTPPKGHVDPGEDEWQAALRETKEEAGIDANKLEIHKDFEHVMYYDTKEGHKSVTYWLARFLDSKDVALSHEHQNMKWSPLQESIALSKFKEMETMLRSAEEYLTKKQVSIALSFRSLSFGPAAKCPWPWLEIAQIRTRDAVFVFPSSRCVSIHPEMPNLAKRRKQTKPEKFPSTPDAQESHTQLLKKDTLFGPFSIHEVEAKSPEEPILDVYDSQGCIHRFLISDNSASPLLQVQSVPDYSRVNSLLIRKDPETCYLLTLDTIDGFSNLVVLLVASVADLKNMKEDIKSDSVATTEVDENRERPTKKEVKKFCCVMCQEWFSTSEDLVEHVNYSCTQPPSAIMSVTTKSQSNFLPSLVDMEKESPPVEDPKSEDTQKNGSKSLPKVDTSKISLDLSAKLSAPILLPVAVHDEDSIKVLGPPQFVIPVVVGKNSNVVHPNLLVHPQLCKNINLPERIQMDNGLPNFFLNLTTECPMNSSTNQPQNPPISMKRKSDEPAPLDLSTKIPKTVPFTLNPSKLDLMSNLPKVVTNPSLLQLSSLLSGQIPTTSILPPPVPVLVNQDENSRKFKCACGIEFAKEDTFTGHKNFYCRFRPQANEEANKQSSIKVPEACPHCDFQPSSTSQLNQHVRQQHSVVKCYSCRLCGYRGYSLRGIRCHLKDHINTKGNVGAELEAIFNTFFNEITTNSKPFCYDQCNQSSPSPELSTDRNCDS
ncbi:hypothetical protein FO519_006488 [Halicephalobus sp. NKZ332]|nr:hypothetical protein FO519_006488 [Halicephalobus sp. NKZ332]